MTPDQPSALVGLEGVVHGLIERHLSTEGVRSGEALLAEFRREGVPPLLVEATLMGRGDMPGFLTQRASRSGVRWPVASSRVRASAASSGATTIPSR